MVDHRSGFAAVLIRGEGAAERFKSESGGHRVQRVPPTERRGRVHTSTITVAVIVMHPSRGVVSDRDIDYRTTTGRGPGGQNRNKVETTVVATHRPTGLQVRIDSRSQHENKRLAREILIARVEQEYHTRSTAQSNKVRQEQIGSGMRGDKVRTYRRQDDTVTDHRTGRRWRYSQWEKGLWD